MLGYIEEFNGYRVLLMQGLSIEVATGVDSLVFKMDTMLSRLFTPKLNWEKQKLERSVMSILGSGIAPLWNF